MLEDQVGHGRAHRHFVHSRSHHVAADSDEFQPRRPAHSLCLIPIRASDKNRGNVGEGLDVVDDGWLIPESFLHGKRWLVSRFRSLAFNRFEERRFFSANVSAGADKDFEFESEIGSEDARSQ